MAQLVQKHRGEKCATGSRATSNLGSDGGRTCASFQREDRRGTAHGETSWTRWWTCPCLKSMRELPPVQQLLANAFVANIPQKRPQNLLSDQMEVVFVPQLNERTSVSKSWKNVARIFGENDAQAVEEGAVSL